MTGEDTSGPAVDRCDFCRHPIPEDPVTLEYEGVTYAFCSEPCREALQETEYVFSEYHGFKWFSTGISALDDHLPQGLRRNSFVLLSGQSGTRDRALHAELVWRALQRGEPAVFVTFTEPPGAIVQEFLTLDWNVLPYLARGQLAIVDCFTYRVSDRDRMFDRLNDWNRHLYSVTDGATVSVRDPTDLGEVENKLDNALEDLGMSDRGLVLIDSLTELGSLVQPVQAYDFVKDLRADVCKGRFVPVFAGATYAGDADVFPHDLGYVADGIVDMELNGELVENTLLKRIRIRKMAGVLAVSEWTAYEFTRGVGLVTFDPAEEIEKSRRQREKATGEAAPDAPDGPRAHDNPDASDGPDATDGPDASDGPGASDGPDGPDAT